MKLTSDSETLAENKVLILYILNNIKDGITNNDLYKIVLDVIDMNYFYFQQFLLDLIENNYVVQYQSEDLTLYQITDAGKQTLELTKDILPGIMKLQVDMKLKDAMDEVSNENSITAEYIPKNENYYNITCKIVEKNETIFEIKTFAGSREQAKHIVDNWKLHAAQIYPKLVEPLMADYDEPNSEIDVIESDFQEDSDTNVEDNKPIDGNTNLFDDI